MPVRRSLPQIHHSTTQPAPEYEPDESNETNRPENTRVTLLAVTMAGSSTRDWRFRARPRMEACLRKLSRKHSASIYTLERIIRALIRHGDKGWKIRRSNSEFIGSFRGSANLFTNSKYFLRSNCHKAKPLSEDEGLRALSYSSLPGRDLRPKAKPYESESATGMY